MKMSKILTSILTLPMVASMILPTIVSCNKAESFEKDEWKNVVEHANKGLDDLKAHYGVNSFVGKTKTINLDGFGYRLLVIGENEDFIAAEDGTPTTQKAALTFMFTCALQQKNTNDGSYSPIKTHFLPPNLYLKSDNLWKSSLPCKYFSDYINDELETALVGSSEMQGIKTVSKNSIVAKGSGLVEPQAEKVFLPSLADVFSSDINNFQLPTLSDDDCENQDAYIQEGNFDGSKYCRYSYFASIITEPCSKEHLDLAIDDGHGEPISYWYRTCAPSIEYTSYKEWCWESHTKKMQTISQAPAPGNDDKSECGIVPIFCI